MHLAKKRSSTLLRNELAPLRPVLQMVALRDESKTEKKSVFHSRPFSHLIGRNRDASKVLRTIDFRHGAFCLWFYFISLSAALRAALLFVYPPSMCLCCFC